MALVGDTTDLDVLQYGGEPILPEKDSYRVQLQGGVVTSDFAAGLNKQQIQFLNSPYQVSVTYVGLDAFKAAYLEAFFNNNRGQKFVATLLVGTTDLEEFVVQALGTPQISKTGFNGSISLTYQVEPAIDRCFEQVILDYGMCIKDVPQFWSVVDMGVKAWP